MLEGHKHTGAMLECNDIPPAISALLDAILADFMVREQPSMTYIAPPLLHSHSEIVEVSNDSWEFSCKNAKPPLCLLRNFPNVELDIAAKLPDS